MSSFLPARCPSSRQIGRVLFPVLAVVCLLLWRYSTAKEAFGDAPPVTAVSVVNSTLGNNGWYVTGIDTVFNATASAGNVATINYYYDNLPATTVNFTGLNPSESTEYVYTVNGQHTLYYWSTDTLGDLEATKSAVFKIDTQGPNPWLNWVATRQGNDHTYSFTVNISDSASGIDTTTSQFQYRVDDNSPWGYYDNISACSGNFNANSWTAAGFSSPTLSTGTINFCNSDFGECKKMLRVGVSDLAGNRSSAQFCLGGAWWQTTQGDAYALGFQTTSPPAGQYSADYVVTYGSGGDTGFSSAANLYVGGYTPDIGNPGYSTLSTNLAGKAVPLPGGQLPTVSGVYQVNSDYTIDNGTIPNGLATVNNLGAVVLVAGDLTINKNFSLQASSGLVFVVSGRVLVDHGVTAFPGFYLADGLINLAYNGDDDGEGDSNKQLTVTGALVSSTNVVFNRSLSGNQNQTNPAVIVNFPIGYLLNSDLLNNLSSTSQYNWSEVVP